MVLSEFESIKDWLISNDYTDLEKPILYIHIFAGFVTLCCAYAILVLKKGDKRHKKIGIYFVGGMCTIFATSILLAFIGEEMFELMSMFGFFLAFSSFSFYFAIAGYRQAKIKAGARNTIDKALAVLMLMTGLSLLAISIPAQGTLANASFAYGSVCLFVAAYDFNRFRKIGKPNFYDRINHHMMLMLSGTIVSTTALTTNLPLFSLNWMNWWIPPIIIAPFMLYFSRKLAKNNFNITAEAKNGTG